MTRAPSPAGPSTGLDPTIVMATLRTGVGVLSWLAPAVAWRAFGMGRLPEGSSAVATRLFASRELALALTSAHPATRGAALQAGIVVDSLDAVAGVLGVRRGAPRASLVGVSLGAALFTALGVAGLARERRG